MLGWPCIRKERPINSTDDSGACGEMKESLETNPNEVNISNSLSTSL